MEIRAMWFFKSPKYSVITKIRRQSSTRRPYLESLEDRWLLNAGALDPAFGNGAGYVTTAVRGGIEGGLVLLQPSGNIVVVGTSHVSGVNGDSDYDLSAVTYNPDGTLDTSFGTQGIVVQPFTKQPKTGVSLDGDALEPMEGTGDSDLAGHREQHCERRRGPDAPDPQRQP